MDFIVNDLSKEDEQGKIIFKRMLQNGYKEKFTSAGSLVLMQIPPFAEEYILFILSSSTKQNFNKHLTWMIEKLDITQNTICEYIIVDIIRYLLLCTDSVQSTNTGEKVHRWYILGWLLRFVKSEVFRMLCKQAMFFDWIFFKGGDSGWLKVYDPVWHLIVNSIAKYKEMSEELIDFLFQLLKEYDSVDPQVEQNLFRVFELFRTKGDTTQT